MQKIKIETQIDHIHDFEKVHPKYILFADVLKAILEKAVNIFAPLGVIQARAKTISSFSEKIIRKDKYIKPLEEVTDLCGARVICHFSRQVEKICDFIRDNFEVDELNSLDVKSRLKVGEFGYRSVHYIVTPRQASILGIDIPTELRSLKAEIQVRTFNEHIWADVFHDRIYKAPIRIPNDWKREAARLAAILENADNAFLEMSDTIDNLTINYLPTPGLKKVDNEKEVLKALIDISPEISDKTAVTRFKLVQFYNLQGDFEESITTLTPILEKADQVFNKVILGRIHYELGFALCYNNRTDIDSAYQEGLTHLDKAITLLENESSKQDLAKAWFYKGKTLRLAAKNDSSNIRIAFDKAHQLMCDNPYFFIEFLIEDAFDPKTKYVDIDLFNSRLRECITDCSEHVAVGIEVIQALFTIIKAAILLKDSNLALNSYLKLIDYVLHDKVVFSKHLIENEIQEINKIVSVLDNDDKSLVCLGDLLLWKKYSDNNSQDRLKSLRKDAPKIAHEVLIVAGYGKLPDSMMDIYEPYILEVVRDFKGTVISGGTSCGIPGLVGNKANRLLMTGNKHFNLLGYHPKSLPDKIKPDNNCDTHVSSENNTFSFYDVLMYWLDILFSDTKIESILLAGFGGGAITLLEYKIALALDVKVGLLQDTGGASTELIQDTHWNKKPNLMIVPDDSFTFWVLANRNKTTILSEDTIDVLARKIHGNYLGLADLKEKNVEHYTAIEDWEWKSLDSNLKVSNVKQAEFIEHMLRRVGLTMQEADKPVLFIIDNKFKNYELLTQLEHSRWNAERLLSGWKLGNIKDVPNKISPFIKRWELIPDNIKKYDYEAVCKFPEILMEVGYEIVQ